MTTTPPPTSSNDNVTKPSSVPSQPQEQYQKQSQHYPPQQQMPTIVMNVNPNSHASASIYNMQTGHVYQVQHQGSSWPPGSLVAGAPPPGQESMGGVTVTASSPHYTAVASVMTPSASQGSAPPSQPNLEKEAELALEQYHHLKNQQQINSGALPMPPKQQVQSSSQAGLEKEAELALKQYRQQNQQILQQQHHHNPVPGDRGPAQPEQLLPQQNLELLQQAFNSAYSVHATQRAHSQQGSGQPVHSQQLSAPAQVKQEKPSAALFAAHALPNKRLFLENKVSPLEQEQPSNRESSFTFNVESFKDDEESLWKEMREIAGDDDDYDFPYSSGDVSDNEQGRSTSETGSFSGMALDRSAVPSPSPLQTISEDAQPQVQYSATMYQQYQMQQQHQQQPYAVAAAPPQSTYPAPVSFLPQQGAMAPQSQPYQMQVAAQRAMPPAPLLPVASQPQDATYANSQTSRVATIGQRQGSNGEAPESYASQSSNNQSSVTSYRQTVASPPMTTSIPPSVTSQASPSPSQMISSPVGTSMGQQQTMASMAQRQGQGQVFSPSPAPSTNHQPSATMDYQVASSSPMSSVEQPQDHSPALTAMSQPIPSPALTAMSQPTFASPVVTSMGQPTVPPTTSPRKASGRQKPTRAACGTSAKHKKVQVFGGGKLENLQGKQVGGTGEMSPNDVLTRILQERGYHTYQMPGLKSGYNAKPTPLQLASFGTQLVQAVHKSDVSHLKALLDCGLSPNPCNAFGDSLLDIVCKRSNFPVFKCLMDYGCNLRVCDGFGRTPLHDAAWAGSFSEPLVDLILRKDPLQVLIQDKHGRTPMQYIRKQFWGIWSEFLFRNKDTYWPVGGSFQAPPSSEPRQDPADAISLDLAKAVASGNISVDEVRAMDAATRKMYKTDNTPKSQGVFKLSS